MDLRETLAVLREANARSATLEHLFDGKIVVLKSIEFFPEREPDRPADPAAHQEEELPWNADDPIARANLRKKEQPSG